MTKEPIYASSVNIPDPENDVQYILLKENCVEFSIRGHVVLFKSATKTPQELFNDFVAKNSFVQVGNIQGLAIRERASDPVVLTGCNWDYQKPLHVLLEQVRVDILVDKDFTYNAVRANGKPQGS